MPKRKTNQKKKRPQAHPQHEKDQKAKMMIAMQIALIAGTIVAVVGGFLISYGNHKIFSVWITFVGIVLIALSGALYLHAEALPSLPISEPLPAPSPQPTPMQQQPINISSVNQSGGITAHTVSVSQQPPRRSISNPQLDHIKKALAQAPKGDISMVFMESDLEAVAFADEIERALISCGYNLTVNRVMMMSGPKGYPIGLFFEIADPKSIPPHAQAIGDAFMSCGITVLPSVRPGAEPTKLSITVGGMPR